MNETGSAGMEIIDIKTQNISPQDLDAAKEFIGSYEALFSKRARKFRAQGLHEKVLTEDDYRTLILEEYTFLKRPVYFVGNEVFAGNTKKTVDAIKKAMNVE